MIPPPLLDLRGNRNGIPPRSNYAKWHNRVSLLNYQFAIESHLVKQTPSLQLSSKVAKSLLNLQTNSAGKGFIACVCKYQRKIAELTGWRGAQVLAALYRFE